MTRLASRLRSPLPPDALAPAAPRRAHAILDSIADHWIGLLMFTLAGYALVGRGFAYLGVPPLFIGELTLVLGVATLFTCRHMGRILGSGIAWWLIGFMLWGACCTIPQFSVHGLDAARDGVSWGYSAFALIVATLLAAKPARLAALDARYRTLIKLLLILGPVAWILTRMGPYLPTIPGTHVPLVDVKGGDQSVHLTGVYAYLVGAGAIVSPWLSLALLPLNLALNVTGRAATASFAAGAIVVALLLPLSRLTLRLLFVVIVVLVIAWSLDLRVAVYEERGRDLSVNQLIENIASTFGGADRGDMQGTKQWRLNWWSDIVEYTFHGKYFWTGKGFGINLADADGYQVMADHSLRNPHNAHMMYLARGGVPLLCLWIAVQLSWLVMTFRAYLIARIAGQKRWSRFFAFLIAYWLAFLVNASFDVFLEGPMGGIWFWTVFGVGMSALWIFKHAPQTLADDEDTPPAPHANPARP